MLAFVCVGLPVVVWFTSPPNVLTYHRQHHLVFTFLNENSPLKIAAWIPDYQGMIMVGVNAKSYDFRNLPIDYVITANEYETAQLKNNPTLSFLENSGSCGRFSVLHKK